MHIAYNIRYLEVLIPILKKRLNALQGNSELKRAYLVEKIKILQRGAKHLLRLKNYSSN
jgi:hypothetical protein